MSVSEESSIIENERGFLQALIGDGTPLLALCGLLLTLSGGFALFLAVTHQLLPHDIQFLGMTENELCRVADCRVLHFMFHDRAAFGGALISIGVLYLWLAEFPLKPGEAWAWWVFAISGSLGFISFLAYLGYGYLDLWHATATILLLPVFIAGLGKSYFILNGSKHFSALFKRANFSWKTSAGFGRICLLATAGGMILGGFVITIVGMTGVFVPEDLLYMNVAAADLNSVNSRLIPLIAHDRAGFGGALATTGIAVFCCIWCARPARSLWQALAISGVAGFATAIGVHPVIGYNNLIHLAPAFLGAGIFAAGLIFSFRAMMRRETTNRISEL